MAPYSLAKCPTQTKKKKASSALNLSSRETFRIQPVSPLYMSEVEVCDRLESSASCSELTTPSSGELWDFLYHGHDTREQVPNPALIYVQDKWCSMTRFGKLFPRESLVFSPANSKLFYAQENPRSTLNSNPCETVEILKT